MEKGQSRHIEGLDALRTLAITLITLFHIFPDFFVGGYIGVCLFLILTGFLLAYSSNLDYAEGKFSVTRYFLKRLKRLYPPLVIVIFVTAGVYHFLLPGALEDHGKEVVSIILGVNNWWQLAMNADYFARVSNASPFTHMWFLGVEIEYVVLWPIIFGLCILIKQWKTSLLVLLGLISAGMMALMSTQGVDISRLYYGTDTRIFACFFGGAMGLWFTNHREDLKKLPISHGILTGILTIPILAATFLFRGQYPALYEGGMLLLTLIFCVMLFAVISDPDLGKSLENPVLKWVGGHSYEIFLWQYPVLFLFQRAGWHNLAYGPALEIVLILVLSLWSNAMPQFLFKLHLPFSNGIVSRFAFTLVTAFSIVIMFFGVRDVLASDFDPNHKPGYKLKMELEQKQAALAKAQAERAAREAAEAERIKTAQEELAAKLRGAGVTMIGDSIMLGSSSEISEVMPDANIDALASRNVCEGAEVAQRLQQEGNLRDTVVVALGTNGPLLEYEPYASGMQSLLQTLGTQRQIYWITVYCSYSEWMAMNNQYLAELAKTRPNFHLIDWYPLAISNPDWLYEDGTHPNMEGAVQYAKLIHDTLAQNLKTE